jgi:hypothetical protein
MKAKIIFQFSIAPEGHTVVHYKIGDEVKGKIAERAIEAGAAIEISDTPVLETKIKRVRRKKKESDK